MVQKSHVETINVEEELQKIQEPIWQEYKSYFTMKSKEVFHLDKISNYAKEDEFFWKSMLDYPERKGKYLRGALIYLTCEAMGGDPKKSIKTAAAMQASQDWILIHDDIEDKSVERRGKPTLHKIYGEAQAINSGDGIQMIMWKMLRDNGRILEERKAIAVYDEMYQMLMRTVFGQSVEIKWIEENRLDLGYEDVYFVVGGKTSYYTIAGPMRLGAIIAGTTPPQLDTLMEFGTYMGRAFQIKDDLLDLTSDFEGLKKQVGNDIYEGKRTVMLIHLIKNAGPVDKKKLLKVLNKTREQKSEDEVKWVIDSMKKYGSLDYGVKTAQEYADKATEIFEKKLTFLKEGKAKEILRALMKYIIVRNK